MTKIDPHPCAPVFLPFPREYALADRNISTFPNAMQPPRAPLPYHPSLLVLPSGKPFPVQPAVENVQACLGLVQGDHVPGRMDPHKREVAAAFHLADFPSLAAKSEGADIDLIISFLPRPIERFRPGIISQPIADKVSVTLHPVSTRTVISYCLR